MNLQNGYKVIYEKTADGKRTFYATKNVVCDPTVDDKIIEATIGEYKLIYEKNGEFYGSKSGIPSDEDDSFTTENFKKVFKTYDYARKTTLMVFFRNYLSFRNSTFLRFFDSLKAGTFVPAFFVISAFLPGRTAALQSF